MQQLQWFCEGEKKQYLSAPMTYSAITKIAHVVNKRYFAKRNGVEMYFSVPNYPMYLARNDAKFIEKEKFLESRRKELIVKLDSESQLKLIEKGNKCIKNAACSHFWSMQSKIKELELDNSLLRKDILENKMIINKCHQDMNKAMSNSLEITNQCNQMKKTLASSESLSRKRKERIKSYHMRS